MSEIYYTPIIEDGRAVMCQNKRGNYVLSSTLTCHIVKYRHAKEYANKLRSDLATANKRIEELEAEKLAMRNCKNCYEYQLSSPCAYTDECTDYPGTDDTLQHWKAAR